MAMLLGYPSPGELISSVTDIGTQCYAHPEDRDEFTRRFMAERLIQRFETQMVRRDKTRIWVSISARLAHKNQGPYYQGFCVDITKRKTLETQLRQAQKMEAIGTLAGGIAHDFNNILGVIIGCSEIALENVPAGSEETILLEKVLGAGRRAKELVNQILTFSRQDKSEIKPLYLGPIVKETLKFIRATTPATIEIVPEIADDTGAALADPTHVHRLLMNLYTNAIHAMQPKGGVLNVTLADRDLTRVDVADHADMTPGPYVELCVRDTGHGMSPQTLERMFDPFFTTKTVGQGTGLGLSVVHGIVKKHNGAILVESRPEKGTVFRIYLPRLDRRHIKIVDEPEGAVPKGTERILLVDDEPELVETLQQILDELGYSITATTSSMDAYDRLRQNPKGFDLVIADLTMPGMTGLDLAAKTVEINPGLPVIVCTGFSELISPEQARSCGVREILFKPVVRWQLATTIRKVLDQTLRNQVQNGRNSDH